jgi:serine/threonine protein kinase
MGSSLSVIFPSKQLYLPGPIIGFGSYGKIREAYRASDEKTFAIKEFEITLLKRKDAIVIANELQIFRRMSPHPFIINLYQSYRDASTVSFVMEKLSGGDLRLALKNGACFTEYEVAYVISCIGSAVHYLHELNIIHRDIKPDNIVLNSNGVPKLVDFGMSCALSSRYGPELFQNTGGTRQYLAPEVLVPEIHYHGYESDFWSLGVVMYELIFRQRPYEIKIPRDLILFVQEHYQESWNALKVSNGAGYPLSPTVNYCFSNDADADAEIPRFIDSHQISSHLQNDTVALDPHLVVYLPTMNASGGKVSPSCRALMSSLLDVRLHLRIGAGDRYSLFSCHPWFTQFNLREDNLPNTLSPIAVDTLLVSKQLSAKYLDFNFFDQVSPHYNSLPSDQLAAINQILGAMDYHSPHFPSLFPPEEASHH